MKSIFTLIVCTIFVQNVQSQTTLECDVYGNGTTWNELSATQYRIDGNMKEYNGCTLTPAFMVAVINPSDSCEPWGTYYTDASGTYNPTNDFGNYNNNGTCRQRVELHFVFQQNSAAQLDSLEQMLLNKIPNGYHVLIYSWINLDSASVSTNNPSLSSTFQSLGWSNFDLTHDGLPFILYTEMGNVSSATELYATIPNEVLNFSVDFICDLEVATVEEEPINALETIVYPNPTTGVVNIDLKNATDAQLNVYALNGQLIYSEANVNGSVYNFELVGDPGLYVLEVIEGNTVSRHKIMKE